MLNRLVTRKMMLSMIAFLQLYSPGQRVLKAFHVRQMNWSSSSGVYKEACWLYIFEYAGRPSHARVLESSYDQMCYLNRNRCCFSTERSRKYYSYPFSNASQLAVGMQGTTKACYIYLKLFDWRLNHVKLKLLCWPCATRKLRLESACCPTY